MAELHARVEIIEGDGPSMVGRPIDSMVVYLPGCRVCDDGRLLFRSAGMIVDGVEAQALLECESCHTAYQLVTELQLVGVPSSPEQLVSQS